MDSEFRMKPGSSAIIGIAMLAVIVLLFALNQSGIVDIIPNAQKKGGVVATQNLEVYFIDAGQGDSALVISPDGHTMLIDAGERNAYTKVALTLDSLNVERLDVVVATHPHSDHIGGMTDVINDYGIGTFYMPDIDNDTKTYDNMVSALKKNNVDIEYVIADKTTYITWCQGVVVRALSPLRGGDYGSSLNDYSIMLNISYNDTSVLFAGDCEETSEVQALEYFASDTSVFSADVLKVAHHGSSTGTSREFLQAVSPKYAVISVGYDNSYGHPHAETLDLLDEFNVIVLRTDESGTIHLTLNGNKVIKNAR